MMSTIPPSMFDGPKMSPDAEELHQHQHQHHHNDDDQHNSQQWPSLDASTDTKDGGDWEMLTPDKATAQEHQQQVRFEDSVLQNMNASSSAAAAIKHCQSTPDLRNYTIVECDDNDDDDLSSNSRGGDSFSIVSGPPSVYSAASANTAAPPKLSFRDMMLRSAANTSKQDSIEATTPQKPAIRKFKSKIVVKPIQRCSKSTGDLNSLINHGDEDDILGDTDAHEYYSRKAQGASGRRNGMKTRPDEAKRLNMTMAKKNMQRQRQGH